MKNVGAFGLSIIGIIIILSLYIIWICQLKDFFMLLIGQLIYKQSNLFPLKSMLMNEVKGCDTPSSLCGLIMSIFIANFSFYTEFKNLKLVQV